MLAVRVSIGSSTWDTSLYPEDGGCLVPVRERLRRAERLAVDDLVTVRIEVGSREG